MYIDVITKFKNIPAVYEKSIQNIGSSLMKTGGYFNKR